MHRKLYRDTEEGALSGVCAGLGNYLQVDKTWIRLIFIVSVLTAPFLGIGLLGPLVYVVLWILVPAKSGFSAVDPSFRPSGTPHYDVDYRVYENTPSSGADTDTDRVDVDGPSHRPERPQSGKRRGASDRMTAGLILLAVGVVFLLHQLGVFDWRTITRYWPVVLIVVGIAIVIGALGDKKGVPGEPKKNIDEQNPTI